MYFYSSLLLSPLFDCCQFFSTKCIEKKKSHIIINNIESIGLNINQPYKKWQHKDNKG